MMPPRHLRPGLLLLLLAARAGASEIMVCPPNPDAPQPAYSQEILRPDGSSIRLAVSDGRAGGSRCRGLSLPVPAKAVLWAAPIPREEAGALGQTVALQGVASPAGFQVSEILGETELSSSAAPEAGNLPPQSPGTMPPAPRSAWVWSPAAWADHPESIWALQARYGLAAVYLTIPTEEGKVRNPELLAGFIKEARRRRMAVLAVSGDPRDVLDSAHPALLARLAAYADYNRTAPEESRLAGVQLDIEPYLLPGYRLAPAAWRERYLATVRKARAALDPALPLDLVMPVWWGGDRDWGSRLLDALVPLAIGITVMNYRTEPQALLAGARPFLEWGSRHGRPVAMALETGPLPDETRRHYRESAEGGELWVLPRGDEAFLVLLAAPAAGLPGRAYRYTHALPVPAARTTFAGRPEALEAAVREVLPRWTASSAFTGLVLHGLDSPP